MINMAAVNRILILGLLGIFLLGLTTCNLRLYSSVPPTGTVAPEVLPHLKALRQVLDEGAAGDMQALFPEGFFFSYALYGLSWVNIGLQSPTHSPEREQALAEARWALSYLDSPAGKAVFFPLLDPPYGMFYNAWRNYLLAGILLLQRPGTFDAAELQDFQSQSELIAAAIQQSRTPFLPSYPGQSWPVDTFPAVVSLRAYTHLLDDRYEPLIAAWLAGVQEQVDVETGLVPHRTDAWTGESLDGARATSQTLILHFLLEIDPAWGGQQYQVFRQQFLTTRLALPGVLEFPPFRSGRGDIDSGPLLTGVSLSATAVFLGTARVYGDEELAKALWQGGEALGLATTTGNGRRYMFGLLPIGDLFVVWSKTAVSWFTAPPQTEYEPLLSWGWRWPLHLISLAIALPVGLFIWRLYSRNRGFFQETHLWSKFIYPISCFFVCFRG